MSLLLRSVHGWGSYGNFDLSAITLGAVGLSLVVLDCQPGDLLAIEKD